MNKISEIHEELNEALVFLTQDEPSIAQATYCLGFANALLVAEWLVKNWHLLPDGQKKSIRKETKEAIDQGRAGMECDVQTWQWLLDQTKPNDHEKE